jgi:hypothetical protein
MARFRVLPLNVMNYEGDPRRQEVLKHELRRLDPDLIALTEVVRTENRDQLDEVLQGSQLHTTHQNQVLSQAPVLALGNRVEAVLGPLPAPTAIAPRTVRS